MSLISRAKTFNSAVACSIFVNPLQFNNAEDLAKYPRQLQADRQLLERVGCNMLFAPTAEEVYAGHQVKHYELGGLDERLEGASRPGHFQGVVNVVERLFHYVRPDAAYFGEKDRQQLAVIRTAARNERWPVTIVGCTTLREPNGLAMSSRNQRLNADDREKASILYKALSTVGQAAFQMSVAEARAMGLAVLAEEPSVVLDHLEIADAESLVPLEDWGDRTEAVAVIAAHVGPVRLIDNITLRR